MADVTTQNFFQDAVLASLLHEDPRYFRRGPEYGIWNRVGYALSRVVVTRTDAGTNTFNYSGMLGMGMGIALSNAYYPDSSVNGRRGGHAFRNQPGRTRSAIFCRNSGRIFVRSSSTASLAPPSPPSAPPGG